MKKLDLTALDVEKLDKKQMAEINGGYGVTPEQARGMGEFWAPRVGMKAQSVLGALEQIGEALRSRYNL